MGIDEKLAKVLIVKGGNLKELGMSVDELLSAVEDLNEPDLESLVNQALLLRARLRSPVLSSEETGLLREINQGIP